MDQHTQGRGDSSTSSSKLIFDKEKVFKSLINLQDTIERISFFFQQPQSQPQPFQFIQPQNNNNVISQTVEDDEFDDFVGPSTD